MAKDCQGYLPSRIFPSLTDVVQFVADAASEVNDPVYGGLFADNRKQPQGSKQSHGSRSYPQPGVSFVRNLTRMKSNVFSVKA